MTPAPRPVGRPRQPGSGVTGSRDHALGVYRVIRVRLERWRVILSHRGRRHCGGLYPTFAEALAARDALRAKLSQSGGPDR
jgi:hypothetical protein